jgi:hypothetical protein
MLPRWFSLAAFALANVFIDCEVLFHFFLRHDPMAHRQCHTLLVASALGVVAGWLTFYASRRFQQAVPARWRSSPLWIPAHWPRLFSVCVLSGIVGGVSHVALDSLMHAEILPFWPFSDAGGLYGAASRPSLNLGCVFAGLLGIIFWLVLELRTSMAGPQRPSDYREPEAAAREAADE